MRGRTNITQRTGLAVIGNDVTHKQVVGQKIEVGDFVEFTGNTNIFDILSDYGYTYNATCRMSENKMAIVGYNSNSLTMNITCVDLISGKIASSDNFVLEHSMTFKDNVTGLENVYICYDNGFLYVSEITSWPTISGLDPKNALNFLHIFSVSESGDISFVGQRRFTESFFNSCFDEEDKLSTTQKFKMSNVCVKNGVGYAAVSPSSPLNYTKQRVVKFNVLNDSDISEVLSFFKCYRQKDNSSQARFVVEDFFGYFFEDASILNVFRLENFSNQIIRHTQNIDLSYNVLVYEDVENNYFIIYGKISSTSTPQLYIFTFNEQSVSFVKIEKILLRGFSVIGGPLSFYELYKDAEGNKFFLIAVSTTSSTSAYTCGVALVRYNYLLQTITTLSSHSFGNTYLTQSNGIIKRNNDNVSLYFVGRFGLQKVVNLNKISFKIIGDEIDSTESYDLVQKYKKRIDGVASSSGSEGELISVRVP